MPLTTKSKKKKTKLKEKASEKKKGGKKAGKDTATEKADGPLSGGEEEELTYTERALLDIRIKSLEDKLENRDKDILKLKHETETYKLGYDKEVKDKEDTVAFLKRALSDRAVEISELHERLIGIQQVHRKDIEKLDYRYNQLQVEYQQCKDRLTEENMLLTGKLSALEDFRVQKEDILNKLADTEEKLVERQNFYKDEIDRIEREVLEDKEQLVQDVVRRVDKLSYEFRKASNDQMSFTVKKTIEENVQLHVQLKDAAEKSLTVVRENQTLSRTLKRYKDDLAIYKMTEGKLAIQFEALKKAFKLLSAKCESQKEELDHWSTLENRLMAAEEENRLFKNKIQASEKEFGLTRKELNCVKYELDKTSANLSEEKHCNDKLSSILNQSADVIQQILTAKDNQYSNGDLLPTLLEILIQKDFMSVQRENPLLNS